MEELGLGRGVLRISAVNCVSFPPSPSLAIFGPRGAVWCFTSAKAIATVIRSCRSHERSRRCRRFIAALAACSSLRHNNHVESMTKKVTLKPGQRLSDDLLLLLLLLLCVVVVVVVCVLLCVLCVLLFVLCACFVCVVCVVVVVGCMLVWLLLLVVVLWLRVLCVVVLWLCVLCVVVLWLYVLWLLCCGCCVVVVVLWLLCCGCVCCGCVCCCVVCCCWCVVVGVLLL